MVRPKNTALPTMPMSRTSRSESFKSHIQTQPGARFTAGRLLYQIWSIVIRHFYITWFEHYHDGLRAERSCPCARDFIGFSPSMRMKPLRVVSAAQTLQTKICMLFINPAAGNKKA